MHPRGLAGYIIRTIEFVFAVITLALAAALVANQPSGGSPSEVNYSVFVGVFSLLTWFYTVIVSSFAPDGLGAPLIIIILDSLNLLFYFCGGIAMAAAMRVHSCGNSTYVTNNKITAGSTHRCHEGQALTAFLWFGN
jgi:Membrane-associating domain